MFTENFNGFRGLGFAPDPLSGQLDSDGWIVTGLSEGSMTFGDSRILSDFARGIATNSVTTGGIYGFEVESNNFALGVQPTADDFTPGSFRLRLQNSSATPLTEVELSYQLWYRNDQGRSNSLNFGYSSDGTSFTPVSGLNFTSPTAVDGLGWQSLNRSTTLTGLNIAPNAFFFLDWQGNDVSGSGSRDEFAIDDIEISGLSFLGGSEPDLPTDITFIHAIQGNSLSSPLLGTVVLIEAIAVGDFQGATGLSGFYLQEEDSDADADPLTSEGIFIFDNNNPLFSVALGDRVQIIGTVSEFGNSGSTLTQLNNLVSVTVIDGNNPLPSAVTIADFKATNTSTLGLEPYEGMRVQLTETLTVNEYFRLGRFGELVLATDGRLQQPTNVVTPGAVANALQADNNSRRLTLDDGSNTAFPDPIIWGRNGQPLSPTNFLRGGDTVTGLEGILDQRFGVYRIQNNEGANFQEGNPRPTTLPTPPGSLTVASFNVLNFFTTIDDGSVYSLQNSRVRGADSPAEFQRQLDKLVSALVAINADVVGLMELENDIVNGGDFPLAFLVNAINTQLGSTVYGYIATDVIAPAPPNATNPDAIKVGLIYKLAEVTPVGNFAILDSSVDPRFVDTQNRPTLAQTFQETATGERLTVVVNHFKSKGSLTGNPLDVDQGDGQGNNNFTRTQAAIALADWLATDPTASGDSDFLIMGDLNSYALEDPIRALEQQGYTNAVTQFQGQNAYSYVFDGQAGSLDHALVSSSLLTQVASVEDWHINADEPGVYDYDDNIADGGENATNPPLNPPSLYQVNPFRTSDHDPIVLSLDLTSPSNEPFSLQLFHLSDQEAGIAALNDAPRLSAVLNALRQQDLDNNGVAGFANTLTLSSGDAYIGGLFFEASAPLFGGRGRGDIQIQNELGIQAIAFGNHEFDFGTSVVRDLILPATGYEGTNFPYLSSNLDFSTDNNLAPLVTADGQESSSIPNSIAKSTVITLPGGEQIGIVGATTPTLRSISSPGGVTVLPPSPWDSNNPADIAALAAEIQASVDQLLADNPGLDKVILLAHMQQIAIELSLAGALRNVDIIVAGGSNTRLFDSNDRPRAGDSIQGEYPTFRTDLDGNSVAIVNTDGNYKYLGRLVIDFDANGHIIPESYNPNVSGAYATDAQGVIDVGGQGLEDPEIVAITDAIRTQIIAQESNFFGSSRVFLNGQRAGGGVDGVRNQETNLGNLTADANLAIAQAIDSTTIISIKNGGGIRASIGEITVPPGSLGEAVRVAPPGIPGVKPEGGISQPALINALAFNNGLTLLSLTAQELVTVLEHGVSDSTNNADGGQGRFPQVSGVNFSFDLTRPNGDRIQSAAIKDQNGTTLDVLVQNGELQGDATRSFRLVTLNFLASGGDGYPFPIGTSANRVDITQPNEAPRTGVATFAADGSEQDALAEYLAANYSDNPFVEQDTPRELDLRIQNLNFRSDTVTSSTRLGTQGTDILTGTSSNDVIVGYGGRDTITTLGGNDLIAYTSLSDRSDTVTDFAVGSDRLVLTQLLNSIGYGGSNAIADGYVTFTARGSSTIVNIDADGFAGSERALSLLQLNNVTVAAINNPANFIF